MLVLEAARVEGVYSDESYEIRVVFPSPGFVVAPFLGDFADFLDDFASDSFCLSWEGFFDGDQQFVHDCE